MAKVVFDCECPQSIAEARIEQATSGKEIRVVRWMASAKKFVLIDDGPYIVRIRATGPIVGTKVTLKVAEGGKMNPFEDEIRKTPDGNGTGGRRQLTVPEAKS